MTTDIRLFTGIFNNRELAVILWGLFILVCALLQRNLRKSIFDIFRALMRGKIIFILITMLLYVTSIIILFYKTQLWDVSLMKDTILWGIGVAVVLLMNSNKALRDEHHFRKLLLDNLKLILVLEFIVGFYAFSVLTEIVLVPLFVFVGIVSVVAEMKKEHSSVKRIMDSILAILGLLLILFALFSVFSNYQVLVTTVNLRSFLLPPLLTVVYLPFLYIFAIYMAYEELFVSLDFFLRRNKGIAKLAKRKILFLCRLNLGRIIRFSKEKVQQLSVSKNEADVLNVFQKN